MKKKMIFSPFLPYRPIETQIWLAVKRSKVSLWSSFEQIFNPPLIEGSTWSLQKIGPGVLEEKSFKGVEGRRRTKDGVITIAHPEPCSGKLKKGDNAEVQKFSLV